MTYTYFAPVLRFLPPLTITQQELDRAVTTLDKAISTALVLAKTDRQVMGIRLACGLGPTRENLWRQHRPQRFGDSLEWLAPVAKDSNEHEEAIDQEAVCGTTFSITTSRLGCNAVKAAAAIAQS